AAGHRALIPVLVEAERGRHGGRAGRQRIIEQRGDPGPLLLGGRTIPGRLAHHVRAEHVVPDHTGHVHREAAELFRRGEILPVALPAPGNGHVEYVGRQVLDVAQQLLQALAVPGADRGQRERAVPDQDGGDPVLGHRVAQRIPENRRVEVRVDVDESGRDVGARRVEHPLAVRPQTRPDLRDPAGADPDIRRAGRRARTVHHEAAAYQQIIHRTLPAVSDKSLKQLNNNTTLTGIGSQIGRLLRCRTSWREIGGRTSRSGSACRTSCPAGRLVFGVGLGGEDPAELRACGIDPATRGRRMDEALAVLRPLLAGSEVTMRGAFFQLDQVRIAPAPEPRVPIVIGGRSDAALRRVARHGDGWLGLWVSPGRYAAAVELIAKYAADAGRPVPGWQHGMHVWCGLGDSAATARSRLAAVMEAFYRTPFGKFERYCPCGTPAEVAAGLRPYLDAGCRSFNLIPVADTERAAIDGADAVRAVLRGAAASATREH